MKWTTTKQYFVQGAALRPWYLNGDNTVVLAADHERELAERDQRIAELEAGLRWVVNLLHGVSKGAGDGFHHGVSDQEWQDAITEARALLERVRKEDSCQN